MASIRKRPRGGKWQAYFFDKSGKRVWASTGTKNRRLAQRIADRRERAALDPDPAATSTTTLGEALTMLLKDRLEQAKAGKRSLGTLKMYRQKSGQLIRVFEMEQKGAGGEGERRIPFPLVKMTAATVDEYISERRVDGVAEHTIAKELTTLRAALKLCKRRELWSGDLAAVMPDRFSPEYEPRGRFLAPAELPKLLAQLGPDHAARACYCVATSANDSESDRATRTGTTLAMVTIPGTKTDARDRQVPIVTGWQRKLIAYALKYGRGEGDRLFADTGSSSFYSALRRACIAAKIEQCSSNDLRRTFGHWMRVMRVPLELIAPAMGHADTHMLQRVYGKLTPEELAALMASATGDTQVTQNKATQVESSEQMESGEQKNLNVHGAGGEGRTLKGLLPEDFESSLGRLPSPRTNVRKSRSRKAGDTLVSQTLAEVVPLRRPA